MKKVVNFLVMRVLLVASIPSFLFIVYFSVALVLSVIFGMKFFDKALDVLFNNKHSEVLSRVFLGSAIAMGILNVIANIPHENEKNPTS